MRPAPASDVTVDHDRAVALQALHLSCFAKDFRAYVGAVRHLPTLRHPAPYGPARRGLSHETVQLLLLWLRGLVCVVEPIKETGMQDYRLDEIEDRSGIRHPSIGSQADAVAGISTVRAANGPAARLTDGARSC